MNMLRPSVNQLITKNESSYSLVIGVAKRAREIADELYENGKTLEEIMRAIKAGFTSVMIDGSMLTYEENVALSKKVTELAPLMPII